MFLGLFSSAPRGTLHPHVVHNHVHHWLVRRIGQSKTAVAGMRIQPHAHATGLPNVLLLGDRRVLRNRIASQPHPLVDARKATLPLLLNPRPMFRFHPKRPHSDRT